MLFDQPPKTDLKVRFSCGRGCSARLELLGLRGGEERETKTPFDLCFLRCCSALSNPR